MQARWWHLGTSLLAAGAVVLQLILVVQGGTVLDQTDPPDLATRLVRFASYLTIWSNVLVAVVTGMLVRNPQRDGRVWRVLRLNAVVLCFGGGVVHFFWLRPLLDLSGADLVADRLLHVAVPAVAVLGWLVYGPRNRIAARDLGLFLVVPGVWLAYTLVRGVVVDWYPYPFLDVAELGAPRVALNAAVVTVLMLLLAIAAWRLDRVLPQSRPGVRSSG